MSNAATDTNFTYLCFHLSTEKLNAECKTRLEHLGVECLQEGGSHRAYGIVPYPIELLKLISRDPDIESVAVGSPPSGF